MKHHTRSGGPTPCRASAIQLLLKAPRFGCGRGADGHMGGPPLLYRRQLGLGRGGGAWAQQGEPRGRQTAGGGHPDSMASVYLLSEPCLCPTSGPHPRRPPEQSPQASVLKVLTAPSACVSEGQRAPFSRLLSRSFFPMGTGFATAPFFPGHQEQVDAPCATAAVQAGCHRLTRGLPASSPSLGPTSAACLSRDSPFFSICRSWPGSRWGQAAWCFRSGDNTPGSNQPSSSLRVETRSSPSAYL